MAHYDRILYATDYSKASTRALAEAVALAKLNRAELLILHVIEPVTQYAAGDDLGGAELYMKLEETTKQEAEASMKKLMEQLGKLKINAKSLLVRGTAYDQIVRAAKSRRQTF
jgi:nucleotide-binding universal stress UspA family protein